MTKGFKDYSLFDEQLNQLKVKLKALGLPSVRRKGHALFARAICPARPDSEQSLPSQQDIRLKLPAETSSLKLALQEIKKIAGALASGKFDWFNYLPATKVAKLKAEAEKRSNPRWDWQIADWVMAVTAVFK